MSKGHGATQKQILHYLRASRVLPANELQWLVAGQDVDISDAVANSFGRALKKLVTEDVVHVESHQLTSFEQVVEVFPFRARSLEIMRLRQRLLPLLANFEPQGGGYGRAENERYVLERANQLQWRSEKRWADIEGEWKEIEGGLYALLPSRVAPHRLIVDVITRGKDLFSAVTSVSHPSPLSPMLKCLIAAYSTRKQPTVVGRLFEFYQRLVPRADRVAAGLFSKVLQIVNIQRHGADTMRKEAADHLLEQAPKLVRSLPGHKEGSRPFGRRAFFEVEPTFSPLLNKVLTKEALQEFRFVSVKP